MQRKILLIFFLTFFTIIFSTTMAQTDSLFNDNEEITYNKDTLRQGTLNISADEEIIEENSVLKEKHHSPTKATLLSTFLPGAGQIYNQQWWKTPVIYAVFGTIAYFAVTNYNGKEKFKKEYYSRVNGSGAKLTDYLSYTDNSIYNLYNAYKDNFQLTIILGVAFYTVQIVDAFVYGHLFSFDMTDDLTFNWLPTITPSCLSLSFSLSF